MSPCASSSRTDSSVSSSAAPQSSRMKASRSAGCDGSIGTYAPPAFSTASSATIKSNERGSETATRVSGLTPCAISRCASRFARRFSSP
ncbi:hypothetical protein ASC88_11390 [Rhizobacter sp. Root29]|nr:hypothetical protein ASC88_11390 [Rhizobacter sp. Root29]